MKKLLKRLRSSLKKRLNYIKDFQQDLFPEKVIFEHEFCGLTITFIRDIERALNAYQAFEEFFEDSKSIPYYIVTPESDIEAFKTLWAKAIQDKKIKKIPIFMTERELLEKANEPVTSGLSMPGYHLQDALRLAFGLTGIARHYFMNDSDEYFIKPFNKNKLYDKKGELKYIFHEVWHNARGEAKRISDTEVCPGHGNKQFLSLGINYYDIEKTIKLLLNIKDNAYRNYTCTPCCFDSEMVTKLRRFFERKNGIKNFVNAIRISPFAFQWYGEWLHKNKKLYPMPFMFFSCDPQFKTWKIKRNHFEDPNKYGIQFQSVDYSSGIGVPHNRVRPNIEFID